MENELKSKKPKTERPVGRQLKGSRREDTVLAQAWNWGRREENGCESLPRRWRGNRNKGKGVGLK